MVRTARHDPALRATIVSRRPLHYAVGAEPLLDRPAHVRAGSGLDWVGARLAIVQDDANFIALVDPRDGAVDCVSLPAGEAGLRLFDDRRGNKRYKLDLEACVAVPDEGGTLLVAFGSGSTSLREQVALVSGLDRDSPVVELAQAPALYDLLRRETRFAGSEMNIEGAVYVDGRVRLFGRGNGAPRGDVRPLNATCDLEWAALLAYLRAPDRREAPAPVAVEEFDLGTLDGVSLGFTDAARIGSSLLFSAAAEASANAVDDGVVMGSVIGWLDAVGGPRYTVLLDADGTAFRGKVEGIATGSANRLYAVVDGDNPETPTELCEVTRGSMGVTSVRFAMALAVTLMGVDFNAHAQSGAQRATATSEPPRPRLDSGADSNDADSYYEKGVALLRDKPRSAADAFYWASRLDPASGLALYGRRVALLLTDKYRLRKYLTDDKKVIRSPEILRIDSLGYEAFLREPFLHRKLDQKLVLYAGAPIMMPVADAAYLNGSFELSASFYAMSLRADPSAFMTRFARSHALYHLQRFDSAAAELTTVLADMRKREETHPGPFYYSKAMFQYMLGITHARRGDLTAAKEAYGRALVEDLSFYMVHAVLGTVALAQGDTAAAVNEYQLAVLLRPDDALLLYGLGRALIQAGRAPEAEAQFQLAIAHNPHFALSYLSLGHVLDAQGKDHEAIATYTAYLERAPRHATTDIAYARQQLGYLKAMLPPDRRPPVTPSAAPRRD